MEQNYPENLDLNLLQDYYQALHAINTQHLKLLDAQLELSWHNSREKEAYKLARELGCNNILSLAKAENINYQTTDRIRLNNYFQNTSNIVAKLKNLVQEKQKNINAKNENITSLKETKKNELEASKINQSSTLEKLKGELLEAMILLRNINKDLQNLKKTKMWYIVSTVIVGIVITLVWKNFFITLIVISVYFNLLWQGMGNDQ